MSSVKCMREFSLGSLVIAAFIVCVGCGGDAPTKGIPATKLQLSQSIDKSLDNLQAIPVEKRGIAFMKLQKPISIRGTAAQKQRWTELMKGVPMPLQPAMRGAPPSGKN